MKKEYFKDIVGQDRAKKKLKFFIDGQTASGVLPHLMFVAPKGCGKTTLAKAAGSKLINRIENVGKTKTFLEINCSTLKSVKQFFNQIVIPHINGKECTVLFDEASELPKDLTMALLTILNPNSENRTTFSYEDYTVDFDFRMQSFMFATTEAQHIFHALMDRCERVDLEEYTYGELAEIVSRNLKGAKWEKGVLEEMSTTLRGNARAAQKIANHIKTYLTKEKRKNFTKKDWGVLKDSLGILPLGLSPIELQVLRILSDKKESSLTRLSAKTGLTKSCLQRDFELYLQKHDLMEISTAGRALTKKGQDYLKEVEDGDY
jgi:Holliday junction resolvasome RuvABC ATP-dependent DNA helicase subunit